METYINDKGEEVVIAEMDSQRLINAVAKYAVANGKDDELVKALKAEAIKRLSPKQG